MQLIKVGKNEAALMGKVVTDGFSDDAVNRWAFNGTAAMLPMFTAMARYLYIPKGYGHRTANGLAGTLWLPPNSNKGYGVLGNLVMAKALIQHAGVRGIKNSLAIESCLNSHRPREPHHYLFAISVNPDLQGTGIGSKLMQAALKRVDDESMPAYLENSKERNLAFYLNHGFKVTKEIYPGKDSPPMWLMWREPQ
jgi:ribosomal protein S18 acetylase RimI-like enzyme